MEILICTDGSPLSMKSAELVTKLGFPRSTRIVILGVSEKKADIERLSTSIDTLESYLQSIYSTTKKIRHGEPIEEILAEVLESSYDLVVVGGSSNQLDLLHPQVGTTTGPLVRKLHTHFLVVRNLPRTFQKILICAGEESLKSETLRLGGEWISKTEAEVGLLHVVKKARKTSETSKDTKPVHDVLLDEASDQLRKAGVKNDIIPHVRHGLIVEEVIKEIDEGRYELLVVGSHYLPGGDRWQGTLLDDVTDQLLNRSTCSILII